MTIHNKKNEAFIKGFIQITENENKITKGKFPGILLGTLGTSLLGNISIGKSVIRTGNGVCSAG